MKPTPFSRLATGAVLLTLMVLTGCLQPVEVSDFDGEQLAVTIKTNSALLLVDFRADWCGPCRLMDPKIEAIAQCYARELRVAKVDIEKHADAARAHEVSGIPCLIIFKHGQEQARLNGNVDCETIVRAVDANL
jgi:thioredoxin 1